MKQLNDERDSYLNITDGAENEEEDQLKTYSSKLTKMIRNINQSKGSNLVYSQFKTIEGLGVLGVALKANDFAEIRIEGSDANPYFSDETIESFKERPEQKRFILFTGEGTRERRSLILNIFNGNVNKLPSQIQEHVAQFQENGNKFGDICWVIGITGAGAEGISLKCCRSVHVMESYWNNVRLEQVKGRAVRICSHKDLPLADREVDIYTYCTVFSQHQLKGSDPSEGAIVDKMVKQRDEGKTSDEILYEISTKKDAINNGFLTIMKETAVDCRLNILENKDVACMNLPAGSIDTVLFDPDLQFDIENTGIQMKRQERPREKEVQVKGAPKSDKIKVERIKIRGVEYQMHPKPNTNGLIYLMYVFNNDMTYIQYLELIKSKQIKPVGEFECNVNFVGTTTPFKDATIRFF